MAIAATVAVAASVIQFNNPPGGADQALFWVCNDCKSKYFEGSGGGGCFIATACCGSADCSQVIELKRFRDDVLLNTRLGRTLVTLYYRLSPPVARLLQRSRLMRRFIKWALIDPVTKIVTRQ